MYRTYLSFRNSRDQQYDFEYSRITETD